MSHHIVSERLLVESLKHLRDRHFLLLGWKDEVYFSEEIAFQNCDVNDAVLERQAVPCNPFVHEVDLLNLISLVVEVLVHGTKLLLELGTNPSKEVVVFILKETDVVFGSFINVLRASDHEPIRQRLKEVPVLFLVLGVEVAPDDSLDIPIDLSWYLLIL